MKDVFRQILRHANSTPYFRRQRQCSRRCGPWAERYRLAVSPLESKVIEGLAASSQYAEKASLEQRHRRRGFSNDPCQAFRGFGVALLFSSAQCRHNRDSAPTHSSETSVVAGIHRPILIRFGLWTHGAAIRFFPQLRLCRVLPSAHGNFLPTGLGAGCQELTIEQVELRTLQF